MASTKDTQLRLTISLRSGEVRSFTVAKRPRNWKSWLMHQMPYGSDFYGADFKLEVI